MKFQPQTAPLTLTNAQLAQPVVHTQQLGAVEPSEIRVDAGGIAHFDKASCRPQPNRAGQMYFATAETEMPAPQGAKAVAQFAAFTGIQGYGLRHVLHAQPVGGMIEYLHRQRLWEVVLQSQADFAQASQRQAAGHLPLYMRRWAAMQSYGVQHGQQQQRQE